MIPRHPVQSSDCPSTVPAAVSLRAYEVYCVVYGGAQSAIVEGDCRGGFGVGELVALLYARSFPREEWKVRFKQATERSHA